MFANRIWQALKSILYDRTTPVQVVNAAYTTSASARPQYLSNGWIVTCARDPYNTKLYFYVSKDSGVTFTQLCYCSYVYVNFSITSKDNSIYLAFTIDMTGANRWLVFALAFDATTVGNVDLYSAADIQRPKVTIYDPSYDHTPSGVSLAFSNDKTALTVAMGIKNSTYPNSFNIVSAKSTDGGVTWTKQDGTAGVDQITSSNSTGQDWGYPEIKYMSNDKPIIFMVFNQSSNYNLRRYAYTTSWTALGTIYDGTTYAQSSPSATVQKYGANAGRIEVVWHGKDATDTSVNNIRYSYSDDNGATWSAMLKLTTGNSNEQRTPSITVDSNGYKYVVWNGQNSKYNIRMLIYKTSWVLQSDITNFTNNGYSVPAVCDNYFNFEKPLLIYNDIDSSDVKFYGKFYA